MRYLLLLALFLFAPLWGATASTSFTAVGTSPVISLPANQYSTASSYTLSGSWVGTMVWQYSTSGAGNWNTLATYTANVGPIVFATPGYYQWACTAFTSGTIVTSTTTPYFIYQQITNNQGLTAFQVDDSGLTSFNLQGPYSSTGIIQTSNATAANAGATQGAIYASAGGISTAGAVQSQLGFGVGSLPLATVPIFLNVSNNNLTEVLVQNSNVGTAAQATVATNNGTHVTQINMFGASFTTAAPNRQDGGQLSSTGAGGLNLNASNAAGVIDFWTNGVSRGSISSAGVWTVGPTSNPGANTFAPPIIYGRNNAAADNLGAVGENITATNTTTYANYTTSATYQQVASIPLTAGKWHVYATGTFNSNGATITASTNAIWAISNTTASASGTTEGNGDIVYAPAGILSALTERDSRNLDKIVNISAAGTWYLNSQATFTASNPQFVGSIRADRMP